MAGIFTLASAMKLPTQVTWSHASVRCRSNHRATRSSKERTPPSSCTTRRPIPATTAVITTKVSTQSTSPRRSTGGVRHHGRGALGAAAAAEGGADGDMRRASVMTGLYPLRTTVTHWENCHPRPERAP